MLIKNSILIIFLITVTSTGFSSHSKSNCTHEGTILSFNSLKCGGCWGWTIKVGEDTIKTTRLPFSLSIAHDLPLPQNVLITVGQKNANQYSSDYPYYDISCIEIITDSNCSDIILYKFIGGKPDITSCHKTERMARKWGFTIIHVYGSCGNTPDDEGKAAECALKNKIALSCLAKTFGDDWQVRFNEEVENESDN